MPLIQQELAKAAPIAVPKIFVDWATEPLFLANLLCIPVPQVRIPRPSHDALIALLDLAHPVWRTS
jgi:hypothetical protein